VLPEETWGQLTEYLIADGHSIYLQEGLGSGCQDWCHLDVLHDREPIGRAVAGVDERGRKAK